MATRQAVSVLAELHRERAIQNGISPDEKLITRLQRRAARIFRGVRMSDMLDPDVQARTIARAKVTR